MAVWTYLQAQTDRAPPWRAFLEQRRRWGQILPQASGSQLWEEKQELITQLYLLTGDAVIDELCNQLSDLINK